MVEQKAESVVQQEIQIGAKHFGCTLMRNNCGSAFDQTGRLVRYGLGNVSKQHQERMASSDLIGITQVVVTPEMVGMTIGVFTAIEVKKEEWNPAKTLDKREVAQNNFMHWVRLNGGLAGFANSVEMMKKVFTWNK